MFTLISLSQSCEESSKVTESTVSPASVDVEAKNDEEENLYPTLYVAVVFGLDDVVKSIIQNDTDVNVNFNDKNAWIPLHAAATFGALVNTKINL